MKKKRSLAILLCVLMVMGLLPVSVFAEDNAGGGEEPPAGLVCDLNLGYEGGEGVGDIIVDKQGPYYVGDTVILTAVPTSGYSFVYWSDYTAQQVYLDNPLSLTLQGDTMLSAVFRKDDEYFLYFVKEGFTYSPYQETYAPGTPITLSYPADEAHQPVRYAVGRDNYGFSPAVYEPIDGNVLIMPDYDAWVTPDLAYSINLSPADHGSLSITPASGPYYRGDQITITGIPESEMYYMDSFIGLPSTASVSGFTASFTMPEMDLSIGGVFKERSYYAVSFGIAPEGGGSMTHSSDPATNAVTVTATANENYMFGYWADSEDLGTPLSTNNPYTFVPEKNMMIVAYFVPSFYRIYKGNVTHGSLTVSPDQTVYSVDTPITLTGVPDEGYTVDYYAMGQVVNGQVVNATILDGNTFNMPAYDVAVSVTFKREYNIKASPSSNEGGSVSGAGKYPAGNTVSLVATANEGYAFVNWTENGAEVSTNASYTFQAEKDRELKANFEPLHTIEIQADTSAITSVDRGQSFKVPIRVISNSGFAAAQISLNYDSSQLTLDSLDLGEFNNPEGGTQSVGGSVYIREGNTTTETGVLFYANFTVKENADYKTVSIGFDEKIIKDQESADISSHVAFTPGDITISKPITDYHIWIGGVQVTNTNLSGNCDGGGTWRYDGDATGGTLTLTNANITGSSPFNDSFITTNIQIGDNSNAHSLKNVTIKLEGENHLSDADYSIHGADNINLTITGFGKLISSGSIYAFSLEIHDTIIESYNMIYAFKELTISGESRVTAWGAEGAIKCRTGNLIIKDGLSVLYPEDIYIFNGEIYSSADGYTDPTTMAIIGKHSTYPLWVGGVQVTSDNLSGECNGGGTWQYVGNSSGGTLTLTDAAISDGYEYNTRRGYTANIYSNAEGFDLTLVLSGETNLNNAREGVFISGGSLAIQGDGILDVNSESNALQANNALNILGGTISAEGGEHGIYAGSLTFGGNSKITATGNNGALYGSTITLNDGLTVIAPEGASIAPRSSGTIGVFKNDEEQTYVSIGALLTGTLTVSGEAVYGQILTAAYTPGNNTGELSYQWMRGGTAITGAAGTSYTLTGDDIGQSISCAVTSSFLNGTLVSEPTAPVAKAAITITADDKNSKYGEETKLLTWQVSGNYVTGDVLVVSLSTTATKESDAREYPIIVSWNDNDNPKYTATLINGKYKIEKVTGTADAANGETSVAVTGLFFTGELQQLVTAPEKLPEGYVKVQYSLDGGKTWNDDIPTATDADNYSVNVKYIGDKNHLDFELEPIPVTIKASWTVTFDRNGAEGDAIIRRVADGGHVEEPAVPIRDGYKFGGWCIDKACTQSYDFDETINGEMILYAKWTAVNIVLSEVSGAEIGECLTLHKGEDLVLTYKFSEGADTSFQHFRTVFMDGEEQEKDKDYSVREGSTIITIPSATINKLSAGSHTLTVEFDNGTIDTNLTKSSDSEPTISPEPTVSPKPTATPTQTPASTNPPTGDENDITLWLLLLIACSVCLGAAIIRKRKMN